MLGVGAKNGTTDVLAHLFGLAVRPGAGPAGGPLRAPAGPPAGRAADRGGQRRAARGGLGAGIMSAMRAPRARPSILARLCLASSSALRPAGPIPSTPAAPATDAAAATPARGRRRRRPPRPTLKLVDFKPTSMLHAEAHEVPRARFPGGRLSPARRRPRARGRVLAYPADRAARGDGRGQRPHARDPDRARGGRRSTRLVATLVKPHPGRFVVFTQVDWTKADEPGFGPRAAAQLRDRTSARGARGLKVLKDLGLYGRDQNGKLVAIDDPRFDPIWREAGRLRHPGGHPQRRPGGVLSSPPTARTNATTSCGTTPTGASPARTPRRWRSAAGGAGPRDRAPPRAPRSSPCTWAAGPRTSTTSRACSSATPTSTSSSARARPSSAASRGARAASSSSTRIASCSAPTCGPSPTLYANFFRWLETADEYFPYYDHPAQGRWHIYGLDLPDAVLREGLPRQRRPLLAALTGWSRSCQQREPSDEPAAAAARRAPVRAEALAVADLHAVL